MDDIVIITLKNGLISAKKDKGVFMKKFFTLVLTICILTSVFCINVFSADKEESSIVLIVSGLKKNNNELERIGSYSRFDTGWNRAMEYAIDHDFMEAKGYDRIVVDLLADWTAVNGEFCNSGKGFNWDAIYFSNNVHITLNMNGHTIDRGLTEAEFAGEVMYIDSGADVIINGGKQGDAIVKLGENPGDIKLGTIKGGYSNNGAGGIHINDDAKVVLNNIIITGNSIRNDQGAGISIDDDATFTMNGGQIIGNKGYHAVLGCAIYVDDATATLNDVLISDNVITSNYTGRGAVCSGAAGYVDGGTLTYNNCTIKNNHSSHYGGGVSVTFGEAVLNQCIVTGNSAAIEGSAIYTNINRGSCIINNSKIIGNKGTDKISVFYAQAGEIHLIDSEYDPYFEKHYGEFFINNATNNHEQPGSIFSEGSMAMVFAVIALLCSIASIGITLYNNKKKTIPADKKTSD